MYHKQHFSIEATEVSAPSVSTLEAFGYIFECRSPVLLKCAKPNSMTQIKQREIDLKPTNTIQVTVNM